MHSLTLPISRPKAQHNAAAHIGPAGSDPVNPFDLAGDLFELPAAPAPRVAAPPLAIRTRPHGRAALRAQAIDVAVPGQLPRLHRAALAVGRAG